MTKRSIPQILLVCVTLTPALQACETNKWGLDLSLYGLAVGMSGDVGIGRVDGELDADFEEIWGGL